MAVEAIETEAFKEFYVTKGNIVYGGDGEKSGQNEALRLTVEQSKSLIKARLVTATKPGSDDE